LRRRSSPRPATRQHPPCPCAPLLDAPLARRREMSKGRSVIKFACSAKSKPPLHRSCRSRLPRLQAVAPMPRFTEALRGVRRAPRGSGLTVGGIAIGVAALALLGALSEKLSRLVEGGRDFATGQITVGGSGTGALTGMTRGGLLSGDQLAALREVPGV